jgi:mannose-1-phosphate guanylyltransferase
MTAHSSATPSALRHQTMVLCAGFGQRLRPLTDELPKPLLPVGDRSVLAHICRSLRASGRSRAIANTHWLPEKFTSVGEQLDVTLDLVHESLIRGVAGAVAGVRAQLEAPVLVWSGDILIEAPPLDELLARARASGDVCLAVAPARGAGTVGLDAAGRVVRVRGEVHGVEVAAADYVSLFAAGERALKEFPELGCLIGDYCLPRMRRGLPVETCPVDGNWWDIGTPAHYLQANLDWLARNVPGEQASFVGSGARIDRAVALASSVIGAGATVTGRGLVESCVLWPGSSVEAPLARSIVTPRGVVRVDGAA